MLLRVVGGPCSFQTLSPGPVSVTNIVFFLGQMVVMLIRWSNRCVVYGLKGVCGPYFMASSGLWLAVVRDCCCFGGLSFLRVSPPVKELNMSF